MKNLARINKVITSETTALNSDIRKAKDTIKANARKVSELEARITELKGTNTLLEGSIKEATALITNLENLKR